MSKTRILIHIVFATKHRIPAITPGNKSRFISYIISIIRNNNSRHIEVNAMPDHVHILLDLRPSLSVSDMVKNIKQSTSGWIHKDKIFENFDKWQEGYFAGSLGPDGVDRCRNYIKNQEQHHSTKDYTSEMERMINLYELEWYPDDWN